MKRSLVAILFGITSACFYFNTTANNLTLTDETNASALAPSPTPEPPKFIDFNVKGIRLDDSELRVRAVFGKPVSRRVVKVDYCGIDEFLEINYPGIEFRLDRGNGRDWSVLEIFISSPNVPLNPTVKIGDSSASLSESFGEPFTKKTNGEKSDVYYLTRDDDEAQFTIRENKIVRIRLYINPC